MGAAGEGERPDAKQNAQLCPTPRQALRPSAKQAAGGAPRPRRKGAKATRQPVARTHERARPAAKPPRRTTERRPAGAGAAAPSPRAPETARPRQRTAARRRGGRRRRRSGGTRARLSAAYSLPSAQGAPFERISSAADADGSDEHGAQTGARPPGAEHSRPAPRAAQGQADGQPGKPPGAKRTGATAQRGRFWPPVRLCGGFFRSLVISLPLPTFERLRMAQNRLIWGLCFVRSSCYTCLGVYDMPPERSKTR